MYSKSLLFEHTTSGKTSTVWRWKATPPLLRTRNAAFIPMLERQGLSAAALVMWRYAYLEISFFTPSQ
jgi:hypothetical protein